MSSCPPGGKCYTHDLFVIVRFCPAATYQQSWRHYTPEPRHTRRNGRHGRAVRTRHGRDQSAQVNLQVECASVVRLVCIQGWLTYSVKCLRGPLGWSGWTLLMRSASSCRVSQSLWFFDIFWQSEVIYKYVPYVGWGSISNPQVAKKRQFLVFGTV